MIELKLDAAFTYPKQFLQVNNFLTVHLLRNTEKKDRARGVAILGSAERAGRRAEIRAGSEGRLS